MQLLQGAAMLYQRRASARIVAPCEQSGAFLRPARCKLNAGANGANKAAHSRVDHERDDIASFCVSRPFRAIFRLSANVPELEAHLQTQNISGKLNATLTLFFFMIFTFSPTVGGSSAFNNSEERQASSRLPIELGPRASWLQTGDDTNK